MLNRVTVGFPNLFDGKNLHGEFFCKNKKHYLCIDKNLAMKRVFLSFLFLALVVGATAQPAGVIRAYAEHDYNRTAGSIGNFAVASDFNLTENFRMGVGLQASTENHYDLDFVYQVDLLKGKKGTLFLENRYLYRYFKRYKLQEFNAMLSAGYRNIHWNFKLGLCNRYIAEVPLRKNGGEGTIFEPMNIVFDVEYNLFAQDHPWNIGAGVSNYREFIIERFTLFYYNLHGYYGLNDQWRLTAEAGLHPCGVLNLSAQPNGFYVNVGCVFNY